MLNYAVCLFQTYRPENGPSEEATSMGTLELLTYPKVRTVLLLTTAFMTPEFSWTASKYTYDQKNFKIRHYSKC